MKILWLTDTEINFGNTDADGHNGRGWVGSALELFKHEAGLNFKVVFNSSHCKKEVTEGNLSFTPFRGIHSHPFKPINVLYRWLGMYNSKKETARLLQLINEYKPDVVHLFGTEWTALSLVPHLQAPLVVHLQGLSMPYYKAYLPPGVSTLHLLGSALQCPSRLARGVSFLHLKKRYKAMAKREARYFSNVPYFMGRTHWDRQFSGLCAPNARYFLVNEVLREVFYQAPKWQPQPNSSKLQLVSTLSDFPYKGLDVLFQTAQVLDQYTQQSFDWHVYGVSASAESVKLFSSKRSTLQKVHIHLHGTVTAETLVQALLRADMYIHPSYIDNSPNSVCEAQYLGTPIIAVQVGGLSSLIEHRQTGLLVPANAPFDLAAAIQALGNDKTLQATLSTQGIAVAEKRHNKDTIKEALLQVYQTILQHPNN